MSENFKILKPAIRGFPIIVLMTVAAVLLAKKYLTYVTPMYESTSKLKLADAGEGVPNNNLFKDFDVFVSQHKIATEIEVITSKILVEKTLSTLDFYTEIYREGKMQCTELYHNNPITVVARLDSEKAYDKRFLINVTSKEHYELTLPNEEHPLKGTMGIPIKTKYGDLLINVNDTLFAKKKDINIVDHYQVEFLSTEKLLAKIYKTLDVVPVDKDVPVIRINIKSNVPEKAALFVNSLAKTYISDYIESKYKAANVTVNFLDEQIKAAREKLYDSENKIKNYRDSHHVINLRQETETDLRKISQMEIQLTNLKMSLEAIDDLNRYIDKGKDDFLSLAPNFEAFTDLLSTEIIKNIKKLQAEKKELLLTYTSDAENVRIIDAKINDLKSYLIESIKNTRKNLQIKYDQLDGDIDAAKSVFINVPQKERELQDLTREFDIYQQSYNFLTEKKIEAEVAQAARIAFHRVITPGEISSSPVSPIKSIIVIVAAMLGIIVSIIGIYVVHFVKGKVNDVDTIERNSQVPVVLGTPFFTNNSKRDEYFLRSAIQLELKGLISHGNMFLFTSFSDYLGHHFHVYHLTSAFLKQSRKVLLIDAVGSLEKCFQHYQHSEFKYLNISDESYRKYSKERMEEFIHKEKSGFDLCIINSEDIVHEKIGLMLMQIVNSNFFVLDSRDTSVSDLLEVDLMIHKFSLSSTYFILNKEGYNPNVAKQLFRYLKVWIKLKLKK